MVDPLSVVRAHGGIARTRELMAAGITARQIGSARQSGRIERCRIGHFIDPSLPLPVKQAATVGGRLTCVSLAAMFGVESLHRHNLHVEVDLHDSRFRTPDDMTQRLDVAVGSSVTLHWSPTSRASRLTVPLVDSLAQAMSCLGFEDAICVIDSALHHLPQLVSLGEIAARLPASDRSRLHHADGSADSVPETVFRLRCRAAGIACRPQVLLPGGLRGDFGIGERMIIEVDGDPFHSGPEAFAKDRERDAWLQAIGYIVFRFRYDQVVNRWHEVESAIRLSLRRGDHLWPSGRSPL